jgi:hypothetical protein
MSPVEQQIIAALLTYGGFGILAACLLVATVYLWKHTTTLQKEILDCQGERVNDVYKQAAALERSNSVLAQLTDVEKQRSDTLIAQTELLRSKLEVVLVNQQNILNALTRVLDELLRRKAP